MPVPASDGSGHQADRVDRCQVVVGVLVLVDPEDWVRAVVALVEGRVPAAVLVVEDAVEPYWFDRLCGLLLQQTMPDSGLPPFQPVFAGQMQTRRCSWAGGRHRTTNRSPQHLVDLDTRSRIQANKQRAERKLQVPRRKIAK